MSTAKKPIFFVTVSSQGELNPSKFLTIADYNGSIIQTQGLKPLLTTGASALLDYKPKRIYSSRTSDGTYQLQGLGWQLHEEDSPARTKEDIYFIRAVGLMYNPDDWIFEHHTQGSRRLACSAIHSMIPLL